VTGTSGVNSTVEVTTQTPGIETSQTVSNTTMHTVLVPKAKADEKKALDKMSAELQSLVACSKKASAGKTAQCKLPVAGTIDVKVQLTSADQNTMKLLEQTRLKIKSGSGTTTVTGAIPIAQLEALAGLEQVKSVTKANETAVMLTPEDKAALQRAVMR